ncbi:nucleolar protein 4-like isoform X1 [Branchiostoma lanceolatum]|uniref:nucleolar protein 4-like isoform X1 n=1 Tax=Branchiostoma lanceolatum TaxID=7740 RepID=UPI003454AA40
MSAAGTVEGERDGGKSQREYMYREFQTWAIQTYGDSGKTKTVTRKKYRRITRYLSGDEKPTTDNAKFRFWVKSKGFVLSPMGNNNDSPNKKGILYVPVKNQDVKTGQGFKRVAVVEDFFSIIYNMHVSAPEGEGRPPKHAGQKRTYRAIAETYSFLPREAVTRFLMSCRECQKRMHITSPAHEDHVTTSKPAQIDFNLPIMDQVLHGKGERSQEQDAASVSSADTDNSDSNAGSGDLDVTSPTKQEADKTPQQPNGVPAKEGKSENEDSASDDSSGAPASPTPPTNKPIGKGVTETAASKQPITSQDSKNDDSMEPINLSDKSPKSAEARSSLSEGLTGRRLEVEGQKGHRPDLSAHGHTYSLFACLKAADSEPKRNASHAYDRTHYPELTAQLEAPIIPEDLSVSRPESRDDDDDDDNDDNDKINDQDVDPERLKAFNMFVRLFVDENLDRMVPISKQPKEKIQAIIESCNRQFPEFNERARKRIRTYLKSCRRMKRNKDSNGVETLRPTPPHLTSAMAESILAAACESEAKRQQDQLKALHQDEPQTKRMKTEHHRDEPPVLDCHSELLPYNSTSSYPNGTSRLGLHTYPNSQSYQSSVTNGPTDLSLKKSPSKSTLNPNEVAAIKQLIAGYRESAAFLYRSADELEQLLLQQS